MKRFVFLFFILIATISKGNSIPCPAVLPGSNQWQLIDRVSNCLDATNACIIGTSIMQADVGAGPYVISASGVYTVCEDLSTTGNDVIEITANNVTLNLNNHTLTTTEGDEAIFLNGVNNVKIYNGQCSAEVGTGITVDNSSKNVQIADVTFSNTLSGISATSAVNLIISSCVMYDFSTAGGTGIACAACDAVLIEDCTLLSTTNLLLEGISITDPQSDGVIVRGCIVQTVSGLGISLAVTASGNLSACFVENCLVSDAATGFSMSDSLVNPTGCVVIGCIAESCSIAGFNIGASAGMVLRDCISRNGINDGYDVFGTNVLLDNCIAQQNGVLGFNVGGSAALSFCEAIGNGDDGFGFQNSNLALRLGRSLASSNVGSGIGNANGNGTIVVNTYSANNSAIDTMAGFPVTYTLNDLFDTGLNTINTVP